MQISKKETPSQPLQPSRRQQLRPKEKSIRTYYETKKHFKTKREKTETFTRETGTYLLTQKAM